MRSYVGSRGTTRPLLLNFFNTVERRKKEQHNGSFSSYERRLLLCFIGGGAAFLSYFGATRIQNALP